LPTAWAVRSSWTMVREYSECLDGWM
jgi:hypothetical protein